MIGLQHFGVVSAIITKLENEIKSQKQDVLKFQIFITQMKAEMYKLREENKVFQLNYVKPGIKDKEPIKLKKNENSKKINSETQTEASYTEKEANTYGKSGKEEYKNISCKYFS